MYATCSFAPEENEVVLHKFLRRHPEALVVDIRGVSELTEAASGRSSGIHSMSNLQPGLDQWNGKTLNPLCARAVRILPTALMPGFFMAELRKPVDVVDMLSAPAAAESWISRQSFR